MLLLISVKLSPTSLDLTSSLAFRMQSQNSVRDSWAYREILRIEKMTKAELIAELHDAINGRTYSWKTVQQKLQAQHANQALCLEWNTLYMLKRFWGDDPSLTAVKQRKDFVYPISSERGQTWEPTLLRTHLVNMRLILIRAGLNEAQGIRDQVSSRSSFCS